MLCILYLNLVQMQVSVWLKSKLLEIGGVSSFGVCLEVP